MTTQYGAPLTGAQMKLLRAAGLPDDVMVKPPYGEANESSKFRYILNGYRLPAKHISYALLEKGWLDIPNVRLWFGGDKAPSDYDNTKELLLAIGITKACKGRRDWNWEHIDVMDGSNNIIAYIAKAESAYPPDGGLKDQVRDPSECQSAFQMMADTVTLNKMTEAEWAQKYDLDDEDDVKAMKVIRDLGLIKPEPTLEDRFWQGKERNSLSQDEAVKALVREAVKFGQENPE